MVRRETCLDPHVFFIMGANAHLGTCEIGVVGFGGDCGAAGEKCFPTVFEVAAEVRAQGVGTLSPRNCQYTSIKRVL